MSSPQSEQPRPDAPSVTADGTPLTPLIDGVITRDDAIWLFTLIDRMDRLPAALFPGGLGDYGATAAHGPFVHVDVRGRLARWRG